MLERKHTPLPWIVSPDTKGHIKSISDKNRMVNEEVGRSTPTVARFDIWSSMRAEISKVGFSKEEERENAEFIVRCVNSHYEMLEALTKINELIYATMGQPLEQERYFEIRELACEAIARTEEQS